jgi:hypothetical protein
MWNPHVTVQVRDTEEKGSDVNLATHLLNDGWLKRYDMALLLSQDTDLCEPVRIVTADLRLPVGLVVLDSRKPSRRLASVSSFVRHITPNRLSAAQLPTPLMGRKGHLIHKPTTW